MSLSSSPLRVAGVPEHFNLPWKFALENNMFSQQGIDLRFREVKEGTGAMLSLLNNNETDVIIALTEGVVADIAKGSDVIILDTYVTSPLCWALSAGINSPINTVQDVCDEARHGELKVGISRFQSGSHLMSCVLANQNGLKSDDFKFVPVGTFQNLRRSVNLGGDLRANIVSPLDSTVGDGVVDASDFFMWDTLMTKPYHVAAEVKRIGEIITPWPCFVIATTKDVYNSKQDQLSTMLSVLKKSISEFYTNSEYTIDQVSKRFNLSVEDSTEWLKNVVIRQENSVSHESIVKILESLLVANILTKDQVCRYLKNTDLNNEQYQCDLDNINSNLFVSPECKISVLAKE